MEKWEPRARYLEAMSPCCNNYITNSNADFIYYSFGNRYLRFYS